MKKFRFSSLFLSVLAILFSFNVYAQLPNIRSVAKKSLPAVVNISTTQIQEMPQNPFYRFNNDDPFNNFFNQFFQNMPKKREIHALGSGFIITKDGYILTNYHVVKHAANGTIKVTLLDTNETYKAKIVGSDPKADIALIKIKANNLPTLPLGDSSSLEIGDWVVAVGNPFGLNGTVTTGIISAKGRVIGEGPFDHFLQTDAAINPGNSGGPLLNLNGEVVGINTAIVAGGQGLGFAIPVNMVKSEMPFLMKGKHIKRGYLGVSVQPLTSDAAKQLHLKSKRGAIISQVMKKSAAEKAGLKPGDIIVGINGHPVKSSGDLVYIISSMRPKTKVNIKIIRDGKSIEKQVILGTRPDNLNLAEGSEQKNIYKTDFGFSVSNITEDLKKKYSIKVDKGVVITSVEPNSFSQMVGLKPGDVIVKLDYKPVANLKDFKKIVSLNKKSNVMFLYLIRGNSNIFITLQR